MDFQVCVVLIHFGFGIISCQESFHREYHHVNQKKTWTDAQSYCREKYTDLATFKSMADINKLSRPDSDASFWWIGLYDDPNSWRVRLGNDTNSWRWSATETTSRTGYHNWQEGQPNFAEGKDLCVRMTTDRKWTDVYCTESKYFSCYSDLNTGEKQYHVIETNVMWEQAKLYCRKHFKDLAMIENAEENLRVLPQPSFDVWIGLYRIPGRWSDGSSGAFRNYANGEPNYSNFDEHCTVELPNHEWADAHCNTEYGFICQEDLQKVRKIIVKMKIQTDGGLSDPATLQQALSTKYAEMGFKTEWKIKPREEEPKKEESSNIQCD